MLPSPPAALLGGLKRVLWPAAARAFSTASGSEGEAFSLHASKEHASLLRLANRPWGASATLPASVVQQATGGTLPQVVGVLRDAFTSFDQAHRPLRELLRKLPSGDAIAVASSTARPEGRVLVDEYTQQEGSTEYGLTSGSLDLLSYLQEQDLRVALVPDVRAEGLEDSTAAKAANRGVSQSTNTVLMVSPTAFGFNEQAAQDNSFMHEAPKAGEGSASTKLTRTVLREFAGLHHQLTEVAGVQVHLFEHSLEHGTPDACFPNNWFSTHAEGEADGGVTSSKLVLYPMKCPNRAAERRADVLKVLRGWDFGMEVDLSGHEKHQKYFEGTGSLVLDRVNGVAYVDISERADEHLAQEWVEKVGYKELVSFRSTDLRGKSVYHTNVMMAVGSGVAIVCAESVADAKERQHLLSKLRKTHEVVEISLQQQDALCGNALEVLGSKDLPYMAMSTQAYNAFTEDQRRAIRRHVVDIVHSPIDTLEKVGGGGVRCAIAELF